MPTSSTELISRLAASGLRGRGGGWFPAATKWQAVLAEGGEPVVVANGAEGEPGSIKDRFLMRQRPREVMAGLGLAARAVGAAEAIVYLKGSFTREAEALGREVGACEVPVEIRRGEESYIVGEETALLESLEGRRAWPRPKPPLPAAVGLFGRPTLVHNVETLARVPAALADAEAFRSREATLVSLWGHLRRPGVHEVALGLPLRELIERWGQGATEPVGMVFPAGPSAAPLGPEQLETTLDPEALRRCGSALGTASILVIGASRCALSVASSLARFFEREACGQCPPCTVGTASLARVLGAAHQGLARPKDLADLHEVAGFMSGHGYCAHGRTAAGAITGLLARFAAHTAQHLAGAGCGPEAACDPFAAGSAERTAVEMALESATP